jgi:isoleucyl-tRNA synthetase
MDATYIESVWWSLKEICGKGLLVRDYRISPYCPRCETALSDHEMGQPDVYRPVTDSAVTVRFPLLSVPPGASPLLGGADLLVWTTTGSGPDSGRSAACARSGAKIEDRSHSAG